MWNAVAASEDIMAKKLLLACEGLRVEIESAQKQARACPDIIYMPQGLHDDPDKMRSTLSEKLAEIESERPEVDTVLLGYGLCGRGMCGVSARRISLIIPRVHDCIPLYVGKSQDDLGMTEENSGILWLSAGMIEYGRLARHLVEDRHREYREKFGEKKAEKMIRAENSVFANYRGVWYVRWQDSDENYAAMAHAVAGQLSLPYQEIAGSSVYLSALLEGPYDEQRFLRLEPGWTIDMDGAGKIVSRKI